MPRFRPRVTLLEDRLVLSTVIEIPIGSVVSDQTQWYEISDRLDHPDDVDVYEFTLSADFEKYGVFFDIDSQDIRLSASLATSLDSVLAVYSVATVLNDPAEPIGTNNDGYDFEGFAVPTTAGEEEALSPDSSLYLELEPDTYLVQVTAMPGTFGKYKLRLLADSNFTTSVPEFKRLDSIDAADTLYLDFDGHDADDDWGDYEADPYDFDDNEMFSPAEQLAMMNIWRVVSEDYSPFNINVTTVEPPSFLNGVAHRQVITSTAPSDMTVDEPFPPDILGVAWINGYSNAKVNTAFTFAAEFGDFDDSISGTIMASAVEIGNTSSHEFGHTLGLFHYGGSNSRDNALMQTPDEGLNRETWSRGRSHSDEPPVITQDDMAVISGPVNTFGYVDDDHAGNFANATRLIATDAVFLSTGLITHPDTDADVFRFKLKNSGQMTIKVDVDEYVNNLDPMLELYSSSGFLLATADSKSSFDASITRQLPAGKYFAKVSSNGVAGSAGLYTLQVAEMDNAAYIRQVYRDLFNREATDAELAKWTGRLDEGTSPKKVVLKIMNSDEYRLVVVEELFAQFVPKNPPALDPYVADLRNGVRREQVLIKLLSTTKYYDAKGGTDEAFLVGLYGDVLGKPINESTLLRHLTSLAMGVPRSSIVQQVVASTDALEKLVTDLTNRFLARNPTNAELDAHVTGLVTGLRVEDVIARLLSSDDYFQQVL